MTNDTIWRALHEIFADVMDKPGIELSRETSAKDIEEWDSITHVLLIVEVEKSFDVKFTASEIHKLQSVGDLADLVDRKGAQGKRRDAA